MQTSRLIELFVQTAIINAVSGNEKPLADFIRGFLASYNYPVTEDGSRHLTKSNTGNLICKVGDGGNFALFSHMDTARPTEGLKPVIDDEKIRSSGDTILGADNRAGVTVMLYLLERIARENIQTEDFTVVFTTCEETSLYGSRFLEIDSRITRAFVFDSSNRPGSFINAACGAIGFKVRITGRASHSGIAPEKGINSLLVTARSVSRLPLGRIDAETTMNIGLIKGGSAVNVIPEITELEGEIRSFDPEKAENHLKNLTQIFKEESEAAGASFELVHFWDFMPFLVPETAEVYQDTIRALTRAGLVPTPKRSLGGSDAHSLNARGIQAVNFGIGAQNPHANEEFILIEDLAKTAEIALELVKRARR